MFSSNPRAFRIIWLAYWAVLFVLTHIPVSPRVPGIPQGDKALHLLAYFGLTLLGGRAMTKPKPPSLFAWAIIYVGYAAIDEYLQTFTGRSMTWGDFVADLIGIALATIVLLSAPRPVGDDLESPQKTSEPRENV